MLEEKYLEKLYKSNIDEKELKIAEHAIYARIFKPLKNPIYKNWLKENKKRLKVKSLGEKTKTKNGCIIGSAVNVEFDRIITIFDYIKKKDVEYILPKGLYIRLLSDCYGISEGVVEKY